MIDTDKYDDEGIELSDGGTICFPERDGRIERIDKDGNTMEVRYTDNYEGQEWYELFDTHKALLAEIKQLRKKLNYAKVTIDDWDKSDPCVTVYLEGCEYVGMLSLYKDENGKVIE